MVYQVVKTYGDNEPWWFFEDWQDDITEKQEFSDILAAETYYKEQWGLLKAKYPSINAHENFLTAFWSEKEMRWCEECDDDLQQYVGLSLLEDFKELDTQSAKDLAKATNATCQAKHCKAVHHPKSA